MKRHSSILNVFNYCIAVLVAVFLSGCTSNVFQAEPGNGTYKEFILVRADEQDDMSSLADRYLHDPQNDWVISAFNDIEKVVPGQELIIPLRPFEWGGLKSNGYQLVPILAYQGFSDKRESSSERIVTKTDFERQMKFLKENGFRVITLEKFFEFLVLRGQIPEKSVLITIDDGWKSTYEIAYPILKTYDYPATLFLCSDLIGKSEALSWEQIRIMSNDGVDIECGTKSDFNLVTHGTKLTLKSYLKELEKELTEPKNKIRQQTGRDCKYFAYPQGQANDLIILLLKKYGYKAAFTESGKANPFFADNYKLGRSVILGNYDLAEFKKNLITFQAKELQ
jgi:peptidoglycan/xylan/chitin deacetylase (PgdA/CDA1 family)